jgi:hypothetical protein
MGIAGGLIILLQVICAVHAVKSGRGGLWIWIIVFVPLVGCAVYLLVEVLPGLRGNEAVRRVGADLVAVIDPGRNLRELEEAVEVSDTVKNRQMLARGYVAAKRYPEAVAQYERCLQGVFKDDACTMLELAYVHFLNHDYDQAKQGLQQLKALHPGFRPAERNLLTARTLEESGDLDGALAEYEGMVRTSSGEETRCRYAMLLARAGQSEKARALFEEILARARRSPRYYRRAQKSWIDTARQHLRETS